MADFTGLLILDVSTPSTPVLLGNYPAGSGLALGVAVSGSTVFVADAIVGLLILDVRQGQLQLTGVPAFASLGQSIVITVSARNLTTVLAETAFTWILDQLPYLLQTTVSDQSVFPGHPLSLRLSSSLFVNPTHSFLGLSIQSTGEATPTWLALASAPIAVGSYPAGSGQAYGVAVSGSTVFVADDSAGLLILDVSTPSNPRLLGNYSAGSGRVNDVTVSGSTAFVVGNFVGLLILDVSTPSNITLLGNYSPVQAWLLV